MWVETYGKARPMTLEEAAKVRSGLAEIRHDGLAERAAVAAFEAEFGRG